MDEEKISPMPPCIRAAVVHHPRSDEAGLIRTDTPAIRPADDLYRVRRRRVNAASAASTSLASSIARSQHPAIAAAESS